MRTFPGISRPLTLAAVFAAWAASAASVFAEPEWIARASGQTRTLNAIASTGSLLVVVGDNGVVSTSPDGVQWTGRSSGTSRALNGVAGQGFLLVAVGANGTILRSSNGGVSWESRPPGTTRALYGVLRTNELFVAVGSQGALYTSPDGIEWTSRQTNTSTDLNALAWNGSRIVAVGDNGLIRSSLDGIAWTDHSVNTSGDDVDAVVWAGSHFIALGENGVMLTSPDGLAWTSRDGPGTVLGVAWDGSRLVAVGQGGAAWTSPDGNAWTSARPGTPQTLRAVVWTGARLVTAGGGGTLFTADPPPPPQAPPPAPTLALPAQFAVDVPLQAQLRWNAAATAAHYRIQVSRVPDFSSLVREDSSSSLSLDLVLSGNAEYFWRVRARNAAGEGPWSEIRVFKTTATIPSAPLLSYPAPFAENVPTPVTLRWERTVGATSYSLQVSRSPDFATLEASGVASDTAWTVGPLEGNTYFYWRVRAVNAAGASEYSTIRRFATGAAALALRPAAAFTLHRGGSQGAQLRFALDRPERVTIRLLDARGREAMTVFDRTLGAGVHEVPIAPNAADALYMLDVRAGYLRETLRIHP